MNIEDTKQASAALLQWLSSQQLDDGESCCVLAYTARALIHKNFTRNRTSEMAHSFTNMFYHFMANAQ